MGGGWRWAVPMAAMLAGCSPQITSTRPLLTAGRDTLRPGLWALIGKEPCALPSTTQTLRWPDCAIPVLVEAGQVSLTLLGAKRASIELAEGTPRVIQLGSTGSTLLNDAPDRHDATLWSYYSLVPAGSSPFSRGAIRLLPCPLDPTAEKLGDVRQRTKDGQSSCVAATPDTVRATARRSLRLDADFQAYWVADYR